MDCDFLDIVIQTKGFGLRSRKSYDILDLETEPLFLHLYHGPPHPFTQSVCLAGILVLKLVSTTSHSKICVQAIQIILEHLISVKPDVKIMRYNYFAAQ